MPNNPKWLRYDPDEDKSRHAAADEACCYEMQRKYGWKLLEIEEINTSRSLLSNLKSQIQNCQSKFDRTTAFLIGLTFVRSIVAWALPPLHLYNCNLTDIVMIQ